MAVTMGPQGDHFQKIEDRCVEFFQEKAAFSPVKMAAGIMAADDFPMHSPHHHFLVPAVLLTAAAVRSGMDERTFRQKLQLARSRAVKVPGGYCGEYGSCGAAVGCGIFACVWLGTTPHSEQDLGAVNRITGEALCSIGRYSGPRCCKRCTFLALLAAEDFLTEHGGPAPEPEKQIFCGFYKENPDCIGEKCVFRYRAKTE